MLAIGSADDVKPIDPTRTDASGADDELEQLRAREHQLQAAYLRDPWNMETQRALVRVQQQIRRREESAQRLADNDPKPPALDADEYARRGLPIRWVATPPPPHTLDLTTPVEQMSSKHAVEEQITLTEAALALQHHPALLARLALLRHRLVELTPRAHAARVDGPHPRAPDVPVAGAPCEPKPAPPPVAMPGNAKAIADRGISLSDALKHSMISSSDELEKFIDEYVAYTAKHPQMKALHDDAVRTGPVILAASLDREEAARDRAIGELKVDAQVRRMQVRAPLPVQQRAAVGEVAIPIAQAVEAIASLHPAVAVLFTALECVSGRTNAGFGEQMDAGERALGIALLLAPHAAKLLRGGMRGAAEIVRIARAAGRTEQEVRLILISAEQLEKERALVISAFEKTKRGVALSATEEAAVRRARLLVADFGGTRIVGRNGAAFRAVPVEPNPQGSWGGPGVWRRKNESMSGYAAAFQERVTGVQAGHNVYVVNNVEFDGIITNVNGQRVLVDAKDRYSQFLRPNGEPKSWFDWKTGMIDKIAGQAQTARAAGIPYEVHCAEKIVADRIAKDLAANGIKGVTVRWRP